MIANAKNAEMPLVSGVDMDHHIHFLSKLHCHAIPKALTREMSEFCFEKGS